MISEKTLSMLFKLKEEETIGGYKIAPRLVQLMQSNETFSFENWLNENNGQNRELLKADIELYKQNHPGKLKDDFSLENALNNNQTEEENKEQPQGSGTPFLIWPSNPFLPGITNSSIAKAAENIISENQIPSENIFIYCPSGESGMWGLSAMSQYAHHKSCTSNIIKGAQRREDVVTSVDSLALYFLEKVGGMTQQKTQESIKMFNLQEAEEGQLSNVNLKNPIGNEIKIFCSKTVKNDFMNLESIIKNRGVNLKVELVEIDVDDSAILTQGKTIYNDISKYITENEGKVKSDHAIKQGTSKPKGKWEWEEIKKNKGAQQYISAVFTDIKNCKNRVLQGKKALNYSALLKAGMDEYSKAFGTFMGAAVKSVAQLSGFGFAATLLQKGLEELNKQKEEQKENSDELFFKQFFMSQYSDSLIAAAGDPENFIEWGDI